MANSGIPIRKYFPRVAEAREAMQSKAKDAVFLYFKAIKSAIRAGDNETATKSLQWYMEHVAVDDNGKRIIDSSVDKTASADNGKPTGPVINVGIKIGGVNDPRELSPAPEVIDITPEKADE